MEHPIIWHKRKSKKPKNPPHANYLEGLELTRYNEYSANGRGAWEYTNLGLIAVGGLSLDLFNQIQEPRLIDGLESIEAEILELKELISEYPKRSKQELQDKIVDYKICLTQYRRILTSNLYFLEVTADGEVFHKIGVTTRSRSHSECRKRGEQRIPEIKRDLLKYYQNGVSEKMCGKECS